MNGNYQGPENPRPFSNKETLIICLELLALCILCLGLFHFPRDPGRESLSSSPSQADSFIQWVDFNVTSQAMNQAFRYDVDTCQEEIHLNWVELLAYLGARYGGDFSLYQPEDMEQAAQKLLSGQVSSMDELAENMKYYDYYREAYGAVLDGMVGYFEAEIPSSQAPGSCLPSGIDGGGPGDPETVWVTKYGLKAFFPLAQGFPYTDYDDFGAQRNYGYQRRHLGHDMMGQVGTPVIAIESGQVEAMGWNQYGGWRLGIRSLDRKRYYYYAHLRQNYPYQSGLQEGSLVSAGDVIGYLGRTGYSTEENTNNLSQPHLHLGIQLIFDESQKEGENQIWISCYELVQFLSMNKSQTEKVDGTKEWTRVLGFRETNGL